MRCLAVCQTELVIRMLDESLMPSFEVEFLVESKPVARRLHDAGLNVISADPRRTDTYLKADITPATCVIVEDTGKRGLRKILEAIRDAGATLVYVLGVGAEEPRKREEELRTIFPEVNYLAISELFGAPLLIEFSRSLTRLKVQQYQRFFSDADRVLILLHNDPDPDAMASGLALRNVLRRTKQTGVIAALQGATRPENLRMANLLDIHVEIITPEQLPRFDRIAMVDVQPHYFGDAFHRVDLVIDHHPEQPGYSAVFKDIRANYGSTSTILTDRQANRVDLEAFSYLYPLADAAMIRKMEGAEITMDRLEYVLKAKQNSRMVEQVFCSFIGASPREDFIPYVADFYLQLEDVKWTIVSGIVNDALVMSVRNLGYSRNAGEFVRKYFADIGSAGGHRAMAKAVVPLRAFRDKFGNLQADQFTDKVLSLALEFLHEHQTPEKKLVKA
jgi:nanoRNase/pAp phosphatase (c-di-AMP/oligoRNAs hydrolase)